MHGTSEPHARHDRHLVAALAADDLEPIVRTEAETLVATCRDCAELFADLKVIAAATAALPDVPRTRDFRITAADAARLRPRGWRGAGRRDRRSPGHVLATARDRASRRSASSASSSRRSRVRSAASRSAPVRRPGPPTPRPPVPPTPAVRPELRLRGPRVDGGSVRGWHGLGLRRACRPVRAVRRRIGRRDRRHADQDRRSVRAQPRLQWKRSARPLRAQVETWACSRPAPRADAEQVRGRPRRVARPTSPQTVPSSGRTAGPAPRRSSSSRSCASWPASGCSPRGGAPGGSLAADGVADAAPGARSQAFLSGSASVEVRSPVH